MDDIFQEVELNIAEVRVLLKKQGWAIAISAVFLGVQIVSLIFAPSLWFIGFVGYLFAFMYDRFFLVGKIEKKMGINKGILFTLESLKAKIKP